MGCYAVDTRLLILCWKSTSRQQVHTEWNPNVREKIILKAQAPNQLVCIFLKNTQKHNFSITIDLEFLKHNSKTNQ